MSSGERYRRRVQSSLCNLERDWANNRRFSWPLHWMYVECLGFREFCRWPTCQRSVEPCTKYFVHQNWKHVGMVKAYLSFPARYCISTFVFPTCSFDRAVPKCSEVKRRKKIGTRCFIAYGFYKSFVWALPRKSQLNVGQCWRAAEEISWSSYVHNLAVNFLCRFACLLTHILPSCHLLDNSNNTILQYVSYILSMFKNVCVTECYMQREISEYCNTVLLILAEIGTLRKKRKEVTVIWTIHFCSTIVNFRLIVRMSLTISVLNNRIVVWIVYSGVRACFIPEGTGRWVGPYAIPKCHGLALRWMLSNNCAIAELTWSKHNCCGSDAPVYPHVLKREVTLWTQPVV